MTDFRRTQNTFGDAFPVEDALHGGFNFDNCRRNELLLGASGAQGQKIKAMKTGTTIVGVVYKVREQRSAGEDPSASMETERASYLCGSNGVADAVAPVGSGWYLFA